MRRSEFEMIEAPERGALNPGLSFGYVDVPAEIRVEDRPFLDTLTAASLALQKEIHGLLRCFAGCDVRHVYREGNQVAHTLCRQAYHCSGVWSGIVSSVVFDKAEEDRRGVLHERAVVR